MGSPNVGSGDGTKYGGGEDRSGGTALECDSAVSSEGQNVPVGNDGVAERSDVHSAVECDIDSAGTHVRGTACYSLPLSPLTVTLIPLFKNHGVVLYEPQD